MKKLFLLFPLMWLTLTTNFAQTIKGNVVDEANTPLSAAIIYIPSSKQHTHSNELGQFNLDNVKTGDTIVINYLGFRTLEHYVIEEDFNKYLNFRMKASIFDLDQITISNAVQSTNQIARIDLKTNPVNSSQEILRKIPGLFIGQHAGGGKAEQIFLRGFDIDHGTDIALNVDGLPVNMVSHAHGQGYADLHFLIPETIEMIDFGKGPYYTDQGNFNTAGYVTFQTKDKLDQSMISMEYGQFNSLRTLAMVDLLGKSDKQYAYLATEYISGDGPFESPQDFNRLNIMGKYTVDYNQGNQLSFLVSRFQSKWNASGQIPQRLVDDGTITRFGAVDDTEGGSTSRTNVALHHTKSINNNSFVKSKAYFSQYGFELFSNFTFFLDDPVNGDQIRQVEKRNIYGFESVLFNELTNKVAEIEWSAGVGLRYDDNNDVGLSHTLNRETTLEQYALGDIDETNGYAFVNAEFDFGMWLINPGLRLDVFNFDYVDNMVPAYTALSENKAIASPKLNILYNPSSKVQLFLKSGVGFHSNDTRVVVAQQGNKILPAAYGVDLGASWKPLPRLWVNAALWYLFLEQEFVYVGDAGIVEPSGKTQRQGIEFGFRYQINNHLFLNSDINYTYARAIDEPEQANYIPLAPDLSATGGLVFRHPSGFNASIQYRYIKDRPANEDNSIVAQGYLITDLNLNYTFNKTINIGIVVENLFDQDWNEAQFATESRLQGESEPIEELHFTPGTPFFFKGSLRYMF